MISWEIFVNAAEIQESAIDRGWFVLKNGAFLPEQAITPEEAAVLGGDGLISDEAAKKVFESTTITDW